MGKGRLGAVDLTRFIMILLIMAHHLYLFGYSDGYLGESCWAWVDYFFILTGYFTMHHYKENNEIYSGNCAQEALRYTLNKFRGFMPYVFAAVTLQYLLAAFPYLLEHNIKMFIDSFADMPYEVLLLSSSGIVWPKMSPIWFLSAMFLTLPVLIYLRLRFKDAWNILCYLIPVLYFGYCGINTNRAWPNDLIRAFSGMALGSFVYVIVSKIKTMYISEIGKFLFTVVELGSFAVCVYITVWNKDCMNLLILLFFLNASILLAGCSYTARLKGFFFDFLGEISLPMFIFHWVIGTIAARIFTENVIRIWIYYLAAIVISAIVIKVKGAVLRKSRVK